MKKIYIINQFANTPDHPGHTRQYETAVRLVNKGWTVRVFCSDFNLNLRKYTSNSFLKLFSHRHLSPGLTWVSLFTTPYKSNNHWRILNQIFFAFHLSLHLFILFLITPRHKHPRIIIGSSPQLPACFFVCLISKLFKIPFVFEVRDLWPQALIDLGSYSEVHPIIKTLSSMESYLYRNSSSTVVLSHGLIDYVKARGCNSVHWLPNGPDLSTFYPTPIPSKRQGLQLIYAGSHGLANSLTTLIKSARLVYQVNPAIQFLLLGDGPEKASLISLAADLPNVKFLDPVPKSAMPLYYQHSDAVLVILSDTPLFRYGVSPNKLYDAYASGRPVITSVTGSINDEVLHNNVGLVAPSGKAQELAKAILNFSYLSITERQAMGDRAVQLATSTYNRDLVVDRLHKLLLET